MLSGTFDDPVQVIETARDNLYRVSKAKLPDAGPRWEAYSTQFRDIVPRFKTPLQAIHYAQNLQGGFESRHRGKDLKVYAADRSDWLANEFPEFSQHLSGFKEIPLASPETVEVLDGRLISSPVLFHTWAIMRCLSRLRPRSVLDIGGGIGSAGRLWLTNPIHRPDCYIDIDLPESLFFAEVYLRTFFPDVEVTYVHERSELKARTASAPRVLLIPPQNHELVSELDIDLVINTGSLQEMTAEYVDFYMELIDRSAAKHFFSINYFAQNIRALYESMNFAAPVMPPNWKSMFLKWYDRPRTSHAEMLFERRSEGSPAGALPADTVISTGDIFLQVFDQVRGIDDPAQIMAVVDNARRHMSFVPKELFWLVRRASRLAPGIRSIAAALDELERMAGDNVASVLEAKAFGIALDRLTRRPIEAGTSVRRADGKSFIVTQDGRTIDIINRESSDMAVGAVESFAPTPLVLRGWAVDPIGKRPAAVLFIIDGRVWAWGRPTSERSDISAGWGSAYQRSGFIIQLPHGSPADLNRLRVYAVLDDGTARELDYAPGIGPQKKN